MSCDIKDLIELSQTPTTAVGAKIAVLIKPKPSKGI